jgi:UDP-N-acetylmuramate--alanine ligase
MAAFGSNARLGEGDLLVAEADESDGSFLRLTPTIAVVTNIDPEHLDYYGSHDKLKAAFLQFIEKVPFYGLAVLCLDHADVQALLPAVSRRHVTYGLGSQADYSARSVVHQGTVSRFLAYRRGSPLGEFCVKMPGEHNVLNTLAAIAVADELEVPLDVISEALETFDGVARRFSVVGEVDGVTLVDDYGHHPAEIQATLDAARGAFRGRVLVAFQPHRYTRTQLLFDEFARAFNGADLLLVTDIYPAGEPPIAGINADALVRAIARHGHRNARYVKERAEVAGEPGRVARSDDAVIALGAGDINRVLKDVRSALTARRQKEGAP